MAKAIHEIEEGPVLERGALEKEEMGIAAAVRTPKAPITVIGESRKLSGQGALQTTG